MLLLAHGDYERYLGDLKTALDTNACRLHAYVLMTNHVHLLVTPMIEHGVPRMMQDLGRKYVRYINHSYRRTGTLWEGRYKSSLIDTDAYLLVCMRYIELNAVRANMVPHPADYRWSSYAYNAYGRVDPVLTPHPLYSALATEPVDRQRKYRDLFRAHVDHATVHAIREAVNQEMVLGRDDFKDRVQQMLARQTRPGKRGRPRGQEVAESLSDYYVW